MTEAGAEQDLLSRARRGLSPTAADQARVRQSIGAAITAGVPLSVAPWRMPGWASKAILSAAIAAAAGLAGYRLGHRAGLEEASPVFLPAVVAPPISAPPVTKPPAVEAAVPARRVSPAGPRVRHPPAQAAAAAANPPDAGSLAREVAALRSVERALRDRQPALALALLQALDRDIPDGKLVEEREATGTIARCMRGAGPFGVDLGEAFADRYPGSVYLERVQQACAEPQTDSPATGD